MKFDTDEYYNITDNTLLKKYSLVYNYLNIN